MSRRKWSSRSACPDFWPWVLRIRSITCWCRRSSSGSRRARWPGRWKAVQVQVALARPVSRRQFYLARVLTVVLVALWVSIVAVTGQYRRDRLFETGWHDGHQSFRGPDRRVVAAGADDRRSCVVGVRQSRPDGTGGWVGCRLPDRLLCHRLLRDPLGRFSNQSNRSRSSTTTIRRSPSRMAPSRERTRWCWAVSR